MSFSLRYGTEKRRLLSSQTAEMLDPLVSVTLRERYDAQVRGENAIHETLVVGGPEVAHFVPLAPKEINRDEVLGPIIYCHVRNLTQSYGSTSLCARNFA